MAEQRQLHLAGFFSAGNVTHAHGAWRHVGATNGFLTGEFYKQIARTLERGKFDLLFLPDGLAIEDSYGENLETGVGLGGQGAVALEPTSVIATMAAVTERLGLGATVSTTYYPPYHVARVFATLDNLSDGRISWNVVTSLNDSEARNFGVDEHLEHDIRYDRADEFWRQSRSYGVLGPRMPCCWTRLAVGSPTPRRFNTSIIVATGCPSVAPCRFHGHARANR